MNKAFLRMSILLWKCMSHTICIFGQYSENILLSPCECIGKMVHFLFLGFIEKKKNEWKDFSEISS